MSLHKNMIVFRIITLKCPSGAVACSDSFLLFLFGCIWDVHRLTFLNFCIKKKHPHTGVNNCTGFSFFLYSSYSSCLEFTMQQQMVETQLNVVNTIVANLPTEGGGYAAPPQWPL